MAALAAAVALGVVVACSGTDGARFDGATFDREPGEAGASQDQTGSFGAQDGGAAGDAGASGCRPRTCADAKANCGPVGDGCGGTVDCGACDMAAGETCGGGGVPSICGKPACTPKTCVDLGANCGAAVDGCGGILASCGSCDVTAGEFCGGGGPNRCGTGTPKEGDGGAEGGGNACTPKTCRDLGVTCGPAADGCGEILPSCGTCDVAAGETCGGGGVPSVCGRACKPRTACPAGLDCGPIADGCGGILSCGASCPQGEICGGGGQPNVCGNSGPACTGLCAQQVTCPGSGVTSLSGTVTTPNGTLPIYGALVYVPSGPVEPFGTGVSCEQCGAAASGSPLVSTTTGADGKFLLPNVPVSSDEVGKVRDIPVVVQLGHWRKQFTVQTTACTNTLAPARQTALPRNKREGDIPLTAISTGRVDALECVFRKIGIDDAEFTDPSGDGRIRFYKDNGAVITPQTSTQVCSVGGGACDANCTKKRSKGGLGGRCVDRQTGGTPWAYTLTTDPAELAKYDLTLFECNGWQDDKSPTQLANVRDYANKGGRVYATHYGYVWLHTNTPWSTTASWAPETAEWASVTANVDTTFPKGQAFARWLDGVGGLLEPLPSGAPPWIPAPRITIDEARHDVNGPVVAPAQPWLTTESPAASVQHYTFNTDWTKPAAQQCGRVLFSDFHVTTQSDTMDVVFPNECDTAPLSAQEKVLAFMLFDLASCVSTTPPQPPSCTPRTCVGQGLSCGQAGDGCGNVISCGTCGGGTTCGGGGLANACGKPACTPQTCAVGQCGTIADGCGGSLTCPSCPSGSCGGGGTPNTCGSGTCQPLACPSPAPGTACGPVADGCGALLACACPDGMPCVNGTCGAPPCTPLTCEQAGANCGQVADGCGGLLACGPCLAPQSCGGGGNANVCGGGVN
jgi:hypothetical protein